MGVSKEQQKRALELRNMTNGAEESFEEIGSNEVNVNALNPSRMSKISVQS
jgi:hypothetical protein